MTNNNQTIDQIIIFFALSGDFPVNQLNTYIRPLTMNIIEMTVPKNVVAASTTSCANVFTLGVVSFFLIPAVS